MLKRQELYLVCAAAGLLAAFSGCAVPVDDDQPGATDAVIATVTVQQRDITSVVVVSGQVSASPVFDIVSPVAGKVSFTSETVNVALAAGARLATVAGEAVTTPAQGQLLSLLVDDGSSVAQRIPLASVRYSGFGVVATVPVEDQYRLYDGAISAKVNIDNGPSGLDCTLVPVSGSDADTTQAGVGVLCLLPIDAPVLSGLSAMVGLTTGTKQGVLSLPVQAVSGRAGQGQVTVVNPDGSQTLVTVGLGITDGSYIEITSGLNLGDTVVAYAPGVGG